MPDAIAKVVAEVDALADELVSFTAELVASPGTYDHKHVARIAGIDHCVAYGPGQLELAHQPDEWVGVDDLVTATKVRAVAMLSLVREDADRGFARGEAR